MGEDEPPRLFPGRVDDKTFLLEPRRQFLPQVAVLDRGTQAVEGVEKKTAEGLAPIAGHGETAEGADAHALAEGTEPDDTQVQERGHRSAHETQQPGRPPHRLGSEYPGLRQRPAAT